MTTATMHAFQGWGIFLFLVPGIVSAAPKQFSGHQVVAVRLQTPADVATVMELESASEDFDVWSEGVGVGTIEVRVSPAQRALLDATGLTYRVVIPDVQQMVAAERSGGVGFFDDFRTNDEHIAFMNNLVAQYPLLASMVNFGTSVEGRPIWGIRITGPGANKPGLLIHGCQHAREWLTPPTVAFLAEQLLASYGSDANTTLLVDSIDWYLIPVLNPDGYEYTWTTDRFWRKNRRGGYGVDLNRNWGYFWGGVGSSGILSSEIYRGPSPFSEPETTALRDFLLANPHVRGHVDLHTYGTLLMWPWGYTNALSPGHSTFLSFTNVMRTLVAAVHGLQYVLGPVYTTIYPASGVSVDWVYGVAGRWSITFELRGFGFAVPASEIILAAEENLPALKYFGAWLAACDTVGAGMGLGQGDAYPDCDANGVVDVCQMASGAVLDCNANFTPDSCDIGSGTSTDCTGNGIPDECELDCNANAVADSCDLLAGIPDCNLNGIPDECDVSSGCGPASGICGISGSCLDPGGHSGVGCACASCCVTVCSFDSYCCEIQWDSICADFAASFAECTSGGQGQSADCNTNLIPDECETDCNGSGQPDDCDVTEGNSPDCNGNLNPDECDVDGDTDGLIDDCDNCPLTANANQFDADFDGKGNVCDACPLDFSDDSDGDGACDSNEACPNDPLKLSPGVCGCNVADVDSDEDTVADCVDLCADIDDRIFAPGCAGTIPAVSTWGLIVMALLLMVGAKVWMLSSSMETGVPHSGHW